VKRVEVRWTDSCGGEGAYWNPDMELEPEHIVTVGLLAKKNKRRLVIIQSQGEESRGGFLVIPRCCVTKIKRLH